MSKAITKITVLLLLITAICWADWHGKVYFGKNPVPYATVTADGAETTSHKSGRFELDTSCGMVPNQYYDNIRAWKQGIGDGYNYVNMVFHVSPDIWGLDVYIGEPE